MAESFASYCERFMRRHQNPVTSALATIGTVVMVAGPAAGVVTRRAQLGAAGFTVGVAIAAAAHLFPPMSLREELAAIFGHPIWAARAEARRIFGRSA